MAIELDNTFTVPAPPEQTWDVLLDVEQIAPCMPGASVLSVDGDEIQGQVKVKLGPLSLTYKGTAKFTEKDQESHTIAIEASGKETRGAGTASANVTATLKPGDSGTETVVSIHTSLNVTGRPAQFGRSLLPEVSGKLIQQFATNLEAMINADTATDATAADETGAAAAGEAPVAAATGTAAAESASAAPANASAPVAGKPAAPTVKQEESLNAFKFVVVPILKRLIPVAAVAAAGAAIAVIFRRLRGRKS
ncbi:MAG: SRPBCC family protein [Trebonia sp.]|jgi:carbon monoxide dehydrogenase subunit G